MRYRQSSVRLDGGFLLRLRDALLYATRHPVTFTLDITTDVSRGRDENGKKKKIKKGSGQDK